VATSPSATSSSCRGRSRLEPDAPGELVQHREFTHREHTFREIAADNEKAAEGKLVLRPRTWLMAMGRYRYGDRDADELDLEGYQTDTGALEEQPGLRRFDVASRIQNLGEATVSWTGVSSVALSLNYRYLRNEYHDTPLGLQDNLQRSAAIDLAYSPSDRIDVDATLGYSWIYTNQASRTSNTGVPLQADSLNWRARLYDEILSATGDVGWHATKRWTSTLPTSTRGRRGRTGSRALLTPPAQDLPGTSYRRQGVGWYALTRLRTSRPVVMGGVRRQRLCVAGHPAPLVTGAAADAGVLPGDNASITSRTRCLGGHPEVLTSASIRGAVIGPAPLLGPGGRSRRAPLFLCLP
jgi:hypothetical protein